MAFTPEEYERAKRRIALDFQKAKNDLDKNYAEVNNEVKRGDIVGDSSGIILVERIITYVPNGKPPCCCYIGSGVTKNGFKPFKNQKMKIYIYQDSPSFKIIKRKGE